MNNIHEELEIQRMTPPKLEELRKIPFQDRYDAFNALSEDDLERLHAEGVREHGILFPAYREYRDACKKPQYVGETCFVAGCDKPAEYEGGDARYYCGMCEEHANIRMHYVSELLFRTRR